LPGVPATERISGRRRRPGISDKSRGIKAMMTMGKIDIAKLEAAVKAKS
jgi:hypothetical protein